jgi:hypothetical protein
VHIFCRGSVARVKFKGNAVKERKKNKGNHAPHQGLALAVGRSIVRKFQVGLKQKSFFFAKSEISENLLAFRDISFCKNFRFREIFRENFRFCESFRENFRLKRWLSRKISVFAKIRKRKCSFQPKFQGRAVLTPAKW